MRVVIPVAGVGTRLRPLTEHVPKVLLPVAGRPILGHILESLGEARPSQVILVVGYRGEQIREYAATFDLPLRFVEQEEQRGLGHAVLQALHPASDGEPLLVLLGDTVFDVDYAALAARDANLLGLRRVADPRRFGIAVVEDGRIRRLVEKPTEPVGDLALVGVYRVRRQGDLRRALLGLVERDITTRGEYQLTDALQLMLEDGATFEPFDVEGWFDCGTPEILLETNRVLLRRAAARAPGMDRDGASRHEGRPGNGRGGRARPAAGAGIGRAADAAESGVPGAAIHQPVHIAPGVELEQAVVGPDAAIGHGSRIVRSTVRDSIVGRGAVVEDAVLQGAIVGDRAVVRNGSFTGMIAPDAPPQVPAGPAPDEPRGARRSPGGAAQMRGSPPSQRSLS